ncbi:MAG: deoxyhypusine synthase [Candidatus Caldarchaeum sp.]|nr:deoxyhypusine synthase [Candidatus Caldarchaeum sp.]MCX8202017.1 deoxyhypusine synthase [Candidatus Caldarchaeum sp.]MDW8063085.1 deoxyhypusine synthase [Candidatus Caldarchaeum sp.]MDW8434830.1 deoxyhypusine synthase [Candidatus Caldarchaeum sp.]
MLVEDLTLSRDVSVAQLLEMMSRMGGFMGEHLGRAYLLLKEMVTDTKSLRMISFTGNVVSTGLRGVLVEMLRRKWFDLVFTTCGAVDHDIARTRSDYRSGSFDADDWELAEKNVHRLGNVFIDQNSYGATVEKEVKQLMEKIEENHPLSFSTLMHMLGKQLDSEKSFLYWCWKRDIPVIVPGVYDGAFGYQLWLQGKTKHLKIDYRMDLDLVNDLMWSRGRKAGLVVGGGISKHHLLWWSQFGGEGLDYAVYISTADEYDGSLSGARPREAVSWHKISPKARHVFVKADATAVLPFLVMGLVQEIG